MLLKSLISGWFAQSCALCKLPTQSNQRLCATCHANLPNQSQRCYQCANPLPATTLSQPLCADCIKRPPYFHRTLVSNDYQFPISHWIYQCKFQRNLFYAAVLSDLLLEKIQQYYNNANLPECIIPVPLHTKRLRQRGYNQAIELAKPIARRLKRPVICFAVQRTRATATQTGLTATARRQNVQNAFQCVTPLPYKHIALIDDVMTTASTLNAVSDCLQKNGVTQIDVWCCARRHKTLNVLNG